ncbi:MAG TPA: winged helix-turn-helix domain-containing protein [Blastocatellia bacterium]|nr:winged helix-turn-helix domain-containing protein [Blastocatellia bacterium]
MNASETGSHSVYDDGYLRIEHDNYYVMCGGRVISLPRKEFLILSRLARTAGRNILSEDIWRSAWGATAFNPRSLRVHISRLRHNLEPYGVRIESMVGVGYRLFVPPENRDNNQTSR